MTDFLSKRSAIQPVITRPSKLEARITKVVSATREAERSASKNKSFMCWLTEPIAAMLRKDPTAISQNGAFASSCAKSREPVTASRDTAEAGSGSSPLSEGLSRRIQSATGITVKIRAPMIWRAARQPKASISGPATNFWDIAPPIPKPRYARPIALPRLRLNQFARRTWLGTGPEYTNPTMTKHHAKR